MAGETGILNKAGETGILNNQSLSCVLLRLLPLCGLNER